MRSYDEQVEKEVRVDERDTKNDKVNIDGTNMTYPYQNMIEEQAKEGYEE